MGNLRLKPHKLMVGYMTYIEMNIRCLRPARFEQGGLVKNTLSGAVSSHCHFSGHKELCTSFHMICDGTFRQQREREQSALCRRWRAAGSAPQATAGGGQRPGAQRKIKLVPSQARQSAPPALQLELQLRAAPFGSLGQLALGPGGDGWLRTTVACR